MAIVAAGRNPAMKSAPVDTEVTDASTKIAMLGGIDSPLSLPRLQAQRRTPTSSNHAG